MSSHYASTASLFQEPLFSFLPRFTGRAGTGAVSPLGARERNQVAGSPLGQLHRQQEVACQISSHVSPARQAPRASWSFVVPLLASPMTTTPTSKGRDDGVRGGMAHQGGDDDDRGQAAARDEEESALQMFQLQLQKYLPVLLQSFQATATPRLCSQFLCLHTALRVSRPLRSAKAPDVPLMHAQVVRLATLRLRTASQSDSSVVVETSGAPVTFSTAAFQTLREHRAASDFDEALKQFESFWTPGDTG